ncbi:MAG: ferrous iron transport protein B [Pseudomonadales bacterium]|nr:ferrous iron transport protein B [Pseudomonadales bacterium]MBO6595826.1 ferrous iron transport protein B [Pseudomonadales bacterium]MBO6822310.1 ferrous iron transport protein B [Pseudomonadales bacterium]
MSTFRIALIGNPNCGKTTLFNVLTGSHQKVGNWPGVTVERKSGTFRYGDHKCEVIDLPGIYSLEQEYLGLDEKIARDFLDSGEFDVIINIIDAGNLQRNLVLTQQLQELGYPMVVAVNMLDVAEQQGILVDPNAMSKELGLSVCPIVASRKTGLDDLLEQVFSVEASNTEPQESDNQFASDKIVRRYHRAEEIAGGVMQMVPVGSTLTERIDRVVLNRWLGVPIFLFMMYLMFTVAVNAGAVFIDFFDILFGAVVVDLPRYLLERVGMPAWLVVLLSDGLGGGIQLVATFIPVIGALFLCLSVMEASGYMARAAFVVDRLMARIGLPGTAFVPLIVGFGCNVPAVMAARSLGRESDRLLTVSMAPFMYCGARLTVYALFAAALFPVNGQNLVFGLYLLGITMAVFTGWLFRRQIFEQEVTPSFQEMPAYHLPVLRNILITSWFRLHGFVVRAGRTIVLVVIALSFLNSFGSDGSFGNEDTDNSALSVIGKTLTPAFAPIGLKEDNWPATVGLFTGLFAKEAVVGTLDALYNDAERSDEDAGMPDLGGTIVEAFVSIRDNSVDLLGSLGDPLGITIEAESDLTAAAESQGVATGTLSNMAALFGTQFAAFCYLVFVLLYAPCVAVLGAIAKESGWRWMVLTFAWTTGLAYVTASCLYQVGTFMAHPVSSSIWLLGCAVVSFIAVRLLRTLGRKSVPQNVIDVVQVT